MVLERPRGGTCPGEALGKSLDPATGRTRVLKFLSICHANMGLYQSRLPWAAWVLGMSCERLIAKD